MREEIRRVWRADRQPLWCDYSDVPPINGVIYTDGQTEGLEVAVDVVREA